MGDKRRRDSSPPEGTCPFMGRRGFLAAAGGLAAASLGGVVEAPAAQAVPAPIRSRSEPFWGSHQGGILTPQQDHTYFATFDIVSPKLADVAQMMQAWTEAAARMCAGDTAVALGSDPSQPPKDSGETIGLAPARLTITFGFGPGLFAVDGEDRFGLTARRPASLVDLPRFNGDQLRPERTGGDISVQACADDPQVVFHAIRQLARIGNGVVQLRWVQTGFSRGSAAKGTARNLMGFKDGTSNPDTHDPAAMNHFVWAGSEGPGWMSGGSYMVVRRIRITLEHWDKMEQGFQEQVVGRQKMSGAPLGQHGEFEAADFNAVDSDGNPVIPQTAHVRLASGVTNDGRRMLRRGYSYNDGANFFVERWPPWRQSLEYDAGLLFVAYQKDPREAFIPVFRKMAAMDAMNQFTTHMGSGIFACPPGVRQGSYIGQALFEGAHQTRFFPVNGSAATEAKPATY